MSTIPTKDQIIALLGVWIRQRPGLEFGNYGDITSYRAELRSIGKDLAHARLLLGAVARSSMTAKQMMQGFRAYSGRLTIAQNAKGEWHLDYCTGQYWPTEYRRAACAVLASMLWNYARDHCMPPYTEVNGHRVYPDRSGSGVSAGDYLRNSFRREFGRGIAQRWFN